VLAHPRGVHELGVRSKNALSFASGAPVPIAGTQNNSVEPPPRCPTLGTLLFYVDGDQV